MFVLSSYLSSWEYQYIFVYGNHNHIFKVSSIHICPIISDPSLDWSKGKNTGKP